MRSSPRAVGGNGGEADQEEFERGVECERGWATETKEGRQRGWRWRERDEVCLTACLPSCRQASGGVHPKEVKGRRRNASSGYKRSQLLYTNIEGRNKQAPQSGPERFF